MSVEEWGVPDLSEVTSDPVSTVEELKHEEFTAKVLLRDHGSAPRDALIVEFTNGITVKLEQRDHRTVAISTYGVAASVTSDETLVGARDRRLPFDGDGRYIVLRKLISK